MNGKVRRPPPQQSVEERTTVQDAIISKFESRAVGMGTLGQVDDDPAENLLELGDWMPVGLRSNPLWKGTTGEYQLLQFQPKPFRATIWRRAIIEKHGDIIVFCQMHKQLAMPFPKPVRWQNYREARSVFDMGCRADFGVKRARLRRSQRSRQVLRWGCRAMICRRQADYLALRRSDAELQCRPSTFDCDRDRPCPPGLRLGTRNEAGGAIRRKREPESSLSITSIETIKPAPPTFVRREAL